MSRVKRKLFAAYGECMNVDHMISTCTEAYPFAWGVIEDHKLEFRSFVNLRKSKACQAPVVLWSVTQEDEEVLDSSEGMELYRKDTIIVKLTDVNEQVAPYGVNHYNEGIDAFVYKMKDEGILPEQAPSLEHYQTILQGYRHNDIDPEPLANAIIITDGKFK
ncbi:gamma-glutamylcyclotransferase family protein [Bacillus sp. FJAT-45350]|uniref:gamma-glutamylcyclotransferase family protein n=1 Tax=Bacillus sp. FJAT-45350 TaxID=2011014 RepID=UPI000BB944EB|nr:gamma-glutamylcyclotransferase family protein [Bacillus sp. FJAT-45350]